MGALHGVGHGGVEFVLRHGEGVALDVGLEVAAAGGVGELLRPIARLEMDIVDDAGAAAAGTAPPMPELQPE